MRRLRGSATLEMAVLVPIMGMLLIGMVQFGQITYTYYTLRKIVYGTATYLSAQQGVNFCDAGDAQITAAINFAISGSADGSQPAIVQGLTADMIQVQALDIAGNAWCSGANPPFPPSSIVVSMPDGYPFQIAIPFLPAFDAIPLRPQFKTPYGGT
jgi:hypothetical protein